MAGIRLLHANQGLQFKQVSCGHVERALILENGSQGVATSLDKQLLDGIPSTLGISSRTRKRKSDSSDEPPSKIPHRTYVSQASISARRVLDSIDEDKFTNTSDVEQKKMFSAMPIGHHHLTLLQCGIPNQIIEDPYIKCFENMDCKNPGHFFKSLEMTLQKADKTNIVLTFGDIIHHQRHLIGWNTCVIIGASLEWPGKQLVVKISHPSIYHESEQKLVAGAKAKAREMASKGKEHWVLNHLPEILHSQDFNEKDCTQKRLMELLIKAEYAEEKTLLYQEHVLRITVSERLFPLDSLTDIKEVGQVFLDILQCHRWLLDHPKILHCDISMTNVMYRRRRGQFCGVLNDFDLSSFHPLVEPSSLHRTGTAPYMSHDLLWPANVGHLYHHDIEALFYVLMIFCCRYEIVRSVKGPVIQKVGLKEEETKPFADWFDRSITWETLSEKKGNFLSSDTSIPTLKSFAALYP
ncbi:hypothetical protein EDD18DRAFT_1292023 [Armillaria luteobubalina]|uniref:Fungal-type protein kinase domain-containing protein n=1 Tax=Armillaria luteobubalina TaxID=153913 RepID=A0AA39PPF0_9AGAR|nr:hypothetical protein EDD18DRAFT_1292023 [Armillaria luteobubalina]